MTASERLSFLFDLVCRDGITYTRARELCKRYTAPIEYVIATALQEELPLYLAHTNANIRALAEMRLKEVQGMSETNKKKKLATRAEILDWVYQRMLSGVSFDTANKEAKKKFEIIEHLEKEEGNDGENGSNRF